MVVDGLLGEAQLEAVPQVLSRLVPEREEAGELGVCGDRCGGEERELDRDIKRAWRVDALYCMSSTMAVRGGGKGISTTSEGPERRDGTD